jgi:hypothetical protein
MHEICAGGWMVKVTFTVAIACPILNVTCPVYVPTPRFALEALMETSWVALFCKLPPLEPAPSQFAPSSVLVDAVQEPGSPQSVMVTVCGAGSLCPWVVVKASDCALVLIQVVVFAGRTMNVTLSVTFMLLS